MNSNTTLSSPRDTLAAANVGFLEFEAPLARIHHDIEQMERDEAGNAMGVMPTHLRVLLHRGRHKLRKALEDAGLQASA